MNETYRFSKFIWNFPLQFSHNNWGDLEKNRRYAIGALRIFFLRRHAEPFAYGPLEKAKQFGEMHYAFLFKMDEETKENYPDIPENMEYEYLAGKIEDEEFVLFSYIWFESLENAKDYVLRHNMTILGGWNEQNN